MEVKMGDNNRSVKFSLEVDRKFEKVSGRLGRNKRTLFIQMVDYFYHTKKDPHDLNDEALKTSIIKGNQHLTGFIKTQEQSLLIPIKQDAERMVSSQRRILEWLSNEETYHHKNTSAGLQQQLQKLNEVDGLVRQLVKLAQAKEQLKSQFLFILDSYIKSREQFGLMTPAREKEELINKVKQLVRNL
ncbi:hypothetical protein BDE36_1384 [Arcticibacter tournemirensis]|nr:BfmA/BtgA family mobilization protein [Arcticibacter tournemirensis]TQM49659.1 hypothetical protein BDE36_1384 [Arcticibacter tournemirensis]